MTKKSPSWKAQFEPFAELLNELHAKINQWLDTKTDDELRRIRSDGQKRSVSNCWWATYDVIPIVLDLVAAELLARERERTRALLQSEATV